MATRYASADFIALLAKEAEVTQAIVQKVLDALPICIDIVFSQAGNQELEIGRFGVISERQAKGKTPPELGGKSYDTQVLSMRWSSYIKEAIQTRAVKRGGTLLSEEEYNYASAA